MKLNSADILEAMILAEKEAGGIMLRARGIVGENKTSARDPVTQYDREVQRMLTERLTAAVPDAAFCCEESRENGNLEAEHVFVIDPIDGTMNFLRHMNRSAVSIAYLHRGETVCGAVYNPYLDEMYTALRGEGAFLNGNRIHTEDRPISETVICCGTAPYYSELAEKTFRMMEAAFRAGLDIRREGSAALDLCSVAAGRAGGFFELRLSLWDWAAAALLVREAGGCIGTAQGMELPLDGSKSSVFAGGKQVYEELLALAAGMGADA